MILSAKISRAGAMMAVSRETPVFLGNGVRIIFTSVMRIARIIAEVFETEFLRIYRKSVGKKMNARSTSASRLRCNDIATRYFLFAMLKCTAGIQVFI